MLKVLVIEDDDILNSGLCFNLQKKEIQPHSAYSIEEAKQALGKEKFDLILIDVNLPDGNGFHFAKWIASRSTTPFIFLTAHNLEHEIIEGLQLGADDYITKPFSIKIVMEKIQAVLRRCSSTKKSEIYRCGSLTMDFENHLVTKEGVPLSLTPTEFEMLQFFCRNREQVLTKEVLLERIWDSKGNYVNEHTLSLNISRLRSKIADEDHEYIKTIYGLGYKWIGDN